MKRVINFWNRSSVPKILTGFALIGALGVLDFLTGYELSFSVFYILPISLVTWSNGRNYGFFASFCSSLVWIVADLASGHPYSHPIFPLWNLAIRFSSFLIVTVLLSSLRSSLERESELARTDPLTGAVNSRSFYDLVGKEINRLQRYEYPFSLVYIDLDNFKTMNDQFGHSIGDQILCTVVSLVGRQIRNTDVLARLGGDEFALLLPQTNQESAKIILPKIQGELLKEMDRCGWTITFSVGVLTCNNPVHTIEELLMMADQLMYAAKFAGKNTIKYGVCQDQETRAAS